jgi:hypothetical protein
MPSYDIRFLKWRDGAKPVYRITETSDFAAICAARKAAESGDGVEVWRGMDCIYAAQEHGGFSMPWSPGALPTPARTSA